MAGTPATVRYIACTGGLGGTPFWGVVCHPHSRCFTEPGHGFGPGGRAAQNPYPGRPGGFLRVPGRFGGQSAGWGAA